MGGARTGARGFGFFGINVDLTEEGIEHVDDIVKLVFQVCTYVYLIVIKSRMERSAKFDSREGKKYLTQEGPTHTHCLSKKDTSHFDSHVHCMSQQS